MTTILIKKKDTAGAPAPGDLTNSAGGTEIAVNTATKRIYTKDSGGNVVELGTNASSSTIDALTVTSSATLSYGTANQIQFLNGSKVLTGSSNLTWNGTTLAVTGSFTATNLSWNQTTLAITGNLTATTDSTFSSTGALTISKGTTAQQPGSPVTGMMRYNSSTNQFEGYSGASPAWKSIGGSALSNDTSTSSNLYPVFAAATTGTAENLYTSNAKYLYKPSTGELQASALVASNGIVVNSQTVSADYTIPSGSNAMSAGPVTVNSGITVTVSSGSVWTVI